MDEFALIKKYFAPLAKDFPGSLNLTDDAAVLDIPAGQQLVVTTDTINEGVHFIGTEDAALIARKLLRVNLSDLAAMGARPYCYFMTGAINKKSKLKWIERFAKGLQQDQKDFGIHLAGGDTTATFGPASFSVTALGLLPKGSALKRGGAKLGDDIYVSGTIGDSALGLLGLKKKLSASRFLHQRYLLPQPRVALGEKLRGVATSCIDISDGLMQDLSHLTRESKASATIHRPLIPLSSSARSLLKNRPALWEIIVSGGDDYELLFTAPKSKTDAVGKISRALKLPLTRIGEITKSKEVQLLNESGKAVAMKRKGFQHFR